MATIGHSNVFATQYAEYRMKVALPNGEYTLVDYSHKYHSRPLDICVGQDEVIVYMGESIFGPDHYSYVWDFRVYVDAKDGDINDDGFADVLVGAPSDDTGANGAAFLINGITVSKHLLIRSGAVHCDGRF